MHFRKQKDTWLGEVNLAEFDSVEEAVKVLGEERTLKMLNLQHRIGQLSKLRAERTANQR